MAEVYRKQIIELLCKIDDEDIIFLSQICIMIKTHLAGKEVLRVGTETWNG